jgi:hypothetical protein
MSNGKYKMVEIPRARPKSGFTLLFEAYMMLVESPVGGNSGIEDCARKQLLVFGACTITGLRSHE